MAINTLKNFFNANILFEIHIIRSIMLNLLTAIQLILYLWQTWQFIVNKCSNMELQHLGVLGNDVSRCTILFIALQLVVSLYNVSKLVCHIILITIITHLKQIYIKYKTNCAA